MKNDIRNLYWPGLYNVKFVHNCSGSILVTLEMNEQIDNFTNFRPAVNPKWHPRTHNCVAVKSYRRHNNFSVVWIENLSNSKHFHISAMSNYTLTMTFFELTVVTATSCPSRRRSFDGFNYSPSKGKTH